MAVLIAHKSDYPTAGANGYGEVEWLPGSHKFVRAKKCVLKKGYDVKPQLYADKTVVLMFCEGSGYITTPTRAYNIDEVSFFVPDFEHVDYTIHAGTDLAWLTVYVDMNDNDWSAYHNTHMVLPYFKPLSQADQYTQACKGPNTKSWTIIPKGHLARTLCGVVWAQGAPGEGTIEKGHPGVDQWNYALTGSDFTVSAAGSAPVEQKEGEWSLIPTGVDHNIQAAPGKTLFYVWFEHMTHDIPLGQH